MNELEGFKKFPSLEEGTKGRCKLILNF